MRTRPSTLMLIVAAIALVLGVAGTATAAKLIDGKTIKAGTVKSKQLKNGTVKKKDLSKPLVAQLDTPAPATVPTVKVTEPANLNLVANVSTQVGVQLVSVATYLTTATVVLTSTGDGVGSCTLEVDGTVIDEGQFGFPAGGGRTTFTLMGVFDGSPVKSPAVSCETPGSGAASDISIISMSVTD